MLARSAALLVLARSAALLACSATLPAAALPAAALTAAALTAAALTAAVLALATQASCLGSALSCLGCVLSPALLSGGLPSLELLGGSPTASRRELFAAPPPSPLPSLGGGSGRFEPAASFELSGGCESVFAGGDSSVGRPPFAAEPALVGCVSPLPAMATLLGCLLK